MKKIFTTILLAAVLMGFVVAPAVAYPDKPVTFVVPWPPGDFEDILTRMIAEEFQKEYGVPATVVNKPGGGGGPFPGAASSTTNSLLPFDLGGCCNPPNNNTRNNR